MHWFPKHFKTMEDFRDAVKAGLKNVTVGDVVEIKEDAVSYYPGGPVIPEWVKKDYYHKIVQVKSKGRIVFKGGKECVLLGRKVDKESGVESAGIMSWIDRDNVIKK